MPGTLLDKASPDVEATGFCLHRPRLAWGRRFCRGTKTQSAYFLMPYLCGLSSLFKIHGLCSHARGLGRGLRGPLLCSPSIEPINKHTLHTHTWIFLRAGYGECTNAFSHLYECVCMCVTFGSPLAPSKGITFLAHSLNPVNTRRSINRNHDHSCNYDHS